MLRTSHFQPEGIDWVIGWRVLEPGQGRYDWTTLDKDLAAATARDTGRSSRSSLVWTTRHGRSRNVLYVSVTLGGTGQTASNLRADVATISRPLEADDRRFGQHFQGEPDLTMVQATGAGCRGRCSFPTTTRRSGPGTGVNSRHCSARGNGSTSAWRTALPTIPSALAIEEPLGAGNSTVLQPLLTYVREHSGMLWVAAESVCGKGTRTSPERTVATLPKLRSGRRLAGRCTAPVPAMETFALAVGGRPRRTPRYYEVYLSDILDAGAAPTLGQLEVRHVGADLYDRHPR